jgi:hypothetical protein
MKIVCDEEVIKKI